MENAYRTSGHDDVSTSAAGNWGGLPLYFTVMAKARSDLRLGGRIEQASYSPGSPLHIVLEPVLYGQPIALDADPVVTVVRPDGVMRSITLASDGDGAYAGGFTDTHLVGPYHAWTEVQATSPNGAVVTRHRHLSGIIFRAGRWRWRWTVVTVTVTAGVATEAAEAAVAGSTRPAARRLPTSSAALPISSRSAAGIGDERPRLAVLVHSSSPRPRRACLSSLLTAVSALPREQPRLGSATVARRGASDPNAGELAVAATEYDIHIKGGTIVDGTRVPRYRGDVWIKDGKIAQLGGRAQGGARPGDRRGRRHRLPRLHRPAHPLRRADPLGPVVHDLGLARRHLGGARQLRVRLRARCAPTSGSARC